MGYGETGAESRSGRKDPLGRYIDGEVSKWKPDVGVVKATVDFAVQIGRFSTE